MLENLSAIERSNCCLICRFVATELFSNHGLSQYVDPSNYGDPMEAVKTFAAEIDRNQIKLERTVGGGVYRKFFFIDIQILLRDVHVFLLVLIWRFTVLVITVTRPGYLCT